ncbi:hypothetical protein CS542_04490 [Pedobacter sp. IW39]|nr:hypothetical protein CS542_04490 [Pedobacter sp. IW39]
MSFYLMYQETEIKWAPKGTDSAAKPVVLPASPENKIVSTKQLLTSNDYATRQPFFFNVIDHHFDFTRPYVLLACYIYAFFITSKLNAV